MSADKYRLAKQVQRDKKNVMGGKPVKNDASQPVPRLGGKERSLERVL